MNDIWRTYQCDRCGGWYAAAEDEDGFHWQPSSCARCHPLRNVAIGRAKAAFEAEEKEEWEREMEWGERMGE